MPRHRAPRGRIHGFLQRVAFDLAVLAGCVAGSALFAGAIYLACALPSGSPERVDLQHGVPISSTP